MSTPVENLEKMIAMADEEIDRTARALEASYVSGASNPAHFCFMLDQNRKAVENRNDIQEFLDRLKDRGDGGRGHFPEW